MQDRVIADMRRWLDAGIDFGHVALNAAAAEFRQNDFAERLLGNLHAAKVPAHFLELEVTETVFLGRGAEYVERALKLLNSHGVRIVLDRKSVVLGKSVSVRVDLGGRRMIKKKNIKT